MNSLNSDMLKTIIQQSGMTMTAIAAKMDISRETLYNKVEKRTEFTATEIKRLSKILGMKSSVRDAVFFGN